MMKLALRGTLQVAAVIAVTMSLVIPSFVLAQMPARPIDRTVLPPPASEFKGKIGPNYKDSTPDWTPALPLAAPKAPNVLLIVLDDVGFGHIGSYGDRSKR
jgi:arylsulfatase